MTFEIGMIRQCEILDRDRNIKTLAVREERVIREKRETVGTDIIQPAVKSLAGSLYRDRAGI